MIPEVADLVGKPFAHCGRGPDAYDCFGITQEVFRRLGIALEWPPADLFEKSEHELIIEGLAAFPNELVTTGPFGPGDVIIMGTNENLHHMAPMVTHKHCLHVSKTSAGVHLTSIESLRRLGYGHMEVRRWLG